MTPRALGLAVGFAASLAQAQVWRPLGPEGGQVTAMAVDPRQATRVFAGVRGGFVYRSDDSGGTWADFSSGLGGTELPVLVADPNAANTLWAATNQGLFRTTDNGASWVGVPTGLTGPAASLVALALDNASPSTIYAGSNVSTVGSNTELLIGRDGGGSWDASALPTMASPSTIALDPMNAGTVYVGTSFIGGGVFKSVDGAKTWNAMNTGLDTVLIDSIAVDPALPSRLYTVTALGAYVSTDSAATWSAIDGGLPAGRGPFLVAGSALYGAVGPQIFKSTDNAASWSPASSGLGPRPVGSLVNDTTRPGRLYAGTIGPGVFLSVDGGGGWAPSNTGLRGSTIRTIASVPGHLWVGLQANGAAHSVDRGATWSRSDAGVDVEKLIVDPLTPATVFAIADSALEKSTNSGATWSPLGSGIDSGVDVLVIAPSMPARLYAGACDTTVWRSDNSGATWAPTASDVAGRCIQFIAVDPTNPDFVVVSAGGGQPNDDMFVSTNGGMTWSPISAGLPANTIYGPVAVDPGSPRRIYLSLTGAAEGLWASTTDGAAWTQVLFNSGSVEDLVVNATTHAVYVATDSSLLRSVDFGGTWVDATFNLPTLFEGHVALGDGTDEAYVGTFGAGLYALPLGALDAGSDAGVSGSDGGMSSDGGSTMTDGGSTMTDGGSTMTDGGSTMTDGGSTMTDGGSTMMGDGGLMAEDGGTGGGPQGQVIGTCGCHAGPGGLLMLLALLRARRRPRR